jgi:dTDP-4-dehydrorhamnose reductase
MILRTGWLYGVFGRNFVQTMLRLGRKRQPIRVVNDQWGSPTSAVDLAGAILEIAAAIRSQTDAPWGTYHYCGKGIATWHGFAEEIFSQAASHRLFQRPVVQAISTDQYPTPAQRPIFSALDCSRIYEKFGILPHPWRESLAIVMERIVHSDGVRGDFAGKGEAQA